MPINFHLGNTLFLLNQSNINIHLINESAIEVRNRYGHGQTTTPMYHDHVNSHGHDHFQSIHYGSGNALHIPNHGYGLYDYVHHLIYDSSKVWH